MSEIWPNLPPEECIMAGTVDVGAPKEDLEIFLVECYKEGIKGWECYLNKRTKVWYARREGTEKENLKIHKISLKLGFMGRDVNIKGNKVKCPCKK